jgi:hypothetical protein
MSAKENLFLAALSPMQELQEVFDSNWEVRRLILHLVQEQAFCLSQIAACHRLHEAEPRLARWLLMAQDRAHSDVLQLTQQFLAQMLGAQRSTVTLIAGALQRSGLIEYSRGKVRNTNREDLESAACDRNQVVQSLYANLYNHDGATEKTGRTTAAHPRLFRLLVE